MSDCSPQHVVVCGGGIIGAATAYYLAKRGVRCTVVERNHCACAASGKACAILARHLCDGTELETMAHKGFDLHMKLAEDEAFGACGYRRLDLMTIEVNRGYSFTSSQNDDIDCDNEVVTGMPPWLDGPVVRSSVLGSVANTAQVHPYHLTHAFLSAAREMAGSEVTIATVKDILVDNGKVTGVMTNQGQISGDAVVVAMGLWSSRLGPNLQIPHLRGQRQHSIILKPSGQITAHGFVTTLKTETGKAVTFQIYPRPDGTVYVTGERDGIEAPDDPADVQPNQDSCKRLHTAAGEVSSYLAMALIEECSASYSPGEASRLPQIGKVPDVQGAYIGVGHFGWGILNGPVTGAALAELIVDGKSKILDLSAFAPSKA